MKCTLVAVCGAGHCDEETIALAEEVGRRLGQAGLAVVCGGLEGVMEAVCKGASSVGGLTVGILGTDDHDDANQYVHVCIPTALGEARNAIVVSSARVVIAIGGGYGTLSEIGFALRMDRPVVGLRTWLLDKDICIDDPIHRVDTPEQAVAKVQELLAAPEVCIPDPGA
jgi:uncharacterized protein (TIGR00725 family)